MGFPTPGELDAEARERLSDLLPRAAALKPKERLAIPPQAMPAQDPIARRKNMNEVALGYSEAQARLEALRCLQCKDAPCIEGCPVRIRIPEFIRAIVEQDYRRAIRIVKETNLLPAVCGRVCPQEAQCQLPCTVGRALKDVRRAVSIGRLERFVADWEREHGPAEVPAVAPETGRRVAVVGSGPAGITAAADLRRRGHAVTIFEAFHRPGGVMIYGIPEFRLPKKIVEQEIETLRAMGVEIRTNFVVGRTRKLKDLLQQDGFDAVFVGTGAGLPRFLGVPGEHLVGVFSANEYLTRSNLMRAYDAQRADTPIYRVRRVAVVGGGNVAMDAARTAVRLGAEEVHVLYRRTEAEMPARIEEIEHAKEEGVLFHFLVSPRRILGDEQDRVRAVEFIHYELGEPDESGRPRPVPLAKSGETLEVDAMIIAIGNDSNPLIRQATPDLKANSHGHLLTDERLETSVPGVFAGGDIVLGSATVILAMGQGRLAAASIHERLARA